MRNFKLQFLMLVMLCSMTNASGKVILPADVLPDALENSINGLINSNENYDKDSVLSILSNAGYLDAGFKTEAGQNILITGNRYYLDKIIIDSTHTVKFKDKYFSQAILNQSLDNILDSLDNNGFYFGQLTIDKLQKDSNHVTAYLDSQSGPQIRLHKLRLAGLKRTAYDLLNRYFSAPDSAIINQALLKNIEQQAGNIPFVNFKPPVRLAPLPGLTTGDVNVRFEEKNQLLLEGGGGYLPQDDLMVWHLNLNLQNPFGQGRNFKLFSERRDKNNQLLDIGFTQPLFIVGLDYLGINISTRDYRDRFYEFSITGNFHTRIRNNYQLGLILNHRLLDPSGSGRSYKTFSSRLDLGYSSYGDKAKERYSFQWLVNYTYRRYEQDDSLNSPSLNEIKNEIKMKYVQPFSRHIFSQLRVEYKGLNTSEELPPQAELFLLGGLNSIRGFRNDQFEAIRALMASVEGQYFISSTKLYTFFDAGYLSNRMLDDHNNIATNNIYRFGYGFGFEFVSNARRLNLALAWNKELPFDQPYLTVLFSSEL